MNETETAFDKAQVVESRALEDIIPLLGMLAFEGRFIATRRGRWAKYLQKTAGDFLVNTSEKNMVAIELKADRYENTGNFFFETWSNKSRHTLGWMFTLHTDLLWYYFPGNKHLYSIVFPALKAWAFDANRIFTFEEKEQRTFYQPNNTCGHLVPIRLLMKELGSSIRQITLPATPASVEQLSLHLQWKGE